MLRKYGIFIFVLIFDIASAQQYQPTWASLESRPIPKWFTNAKFGIFIHWGLYSVPAWATNSYADGFGSNYAEWYWERLNNEKLKIHKEFIEFQNRVYGPNFRYQDFAPMFKAELFDPQLWAKIIKGAGAKYVVLTSKHHDGFALWPSAQSWNWNAWNVGPHRDLAGDLSKAVKEAGLHMGFYYSLYEWYNPVYKSNVNEYVAQHMLPQMKDLITQYKPDVIWSDGDWGQSDTIWKSRDFLAWLYNQSPVKNTIVTNDRWGAGAGHGGFTSTEYGKGNASLTRPWEECRGIGESFGFNRNENLKQYQSSESLVHMLVDIVSRGGNFLLNIGPAADGTIPVIMQQRLKDMGDWLKVNGSAIYETTAWKEAPPQKDSSIHFTKKEKTLYIIVTSWKDDLVVPGISKATSVKMLGTKERINYEVKNDGLHIKAPHLTPATIPCQYAWVYEVEGAL